MRRIVVGVIACAAACSSESQTPEPTKPMDPAPVAVEHPDPDPPAKVAVPAIIAELEKHAAAYREPAAPRELVPYRDKDKWGYADRKTYEVVIAPAYDGAERFVSGRAVVFVGERCGFIDTAGREVVPPKMAGCRDYDDGIAMVRVDKDQRDYVIVDRTGRPIDHRLHRDILDAHAGLIVEEHDRHIELYDHTGARTLVTELVEAYGVSEGILNGRKCSGDRCRMGAIDAATGKEVVPFAFDLIHPFEGGLAFARRDEKWGAIDRTGKEIVPVKYEFIMNGASDELWVANEKFGVPPSLVFDHTGAQVASIDKRLAASFAEGLAPFEVGEGDTRRVGFVDRTGKVVIPARFGFATGFHRGVAWASQPDGRAGLIDQTGKVVVPLKYGSAADYVTIFDDDTTPVREAPEGPGRGLMFWIDRNGHEFLSADTRAWFAKQPHPQE